MTKLDLSQFKPIPGFNSLESKREIQAKIYEEIKDLTPKQRRECFRKASEELWLEREQFQTEQAANDL
jgi:hypothetical protein